jgi:hypothetical protein
MTTAAAALPLLGLRITAGTVELRGITDDHVNRQGKPAVMHRIILEPGNLIRYSCELTVEGLPEFRRSIGLDAPADKPEP